MIAFKVLVFVAACACLVFVWFALDNEPDPYEPRYTEEFLRRIDEWEGR